MGYLGYYFAWLALSYLIRQPWLLVGLLGLWLLRGVVPPPGALLGALSRAGRLREQVRVNRGNITARRDLATIYVDLLRPGRAAELLEEGLALAPDDAELLYLHGLALHRAGQHERALPQLLAAIERDARLRHGAPYSVAGSVLLALKRWDDAADAFERYQDFNSSDVAAHTQLARAYAGQRDQAAARKWLLAGLQTWHGLPGAMKRRQFGAYLKAQWARVTVLQDALAIGVAVLFGAGLGAIGYVTYPIAAQYWQGDSGLTARARAALKACGSHSTGDFAGRYEDGSAPDEEAAALPVVIERDRIVIAAQTYCLSRVLERERDGLHAEAIVYRDTPKTSSWLLDHADSSEDPEGVAGRLLYDVRLNRGQETVRLRLAPVAYPERARTMVLRQKP